MPIYPQDGITSSGNSSTTPLSSGATFTGTGEQNQYPTVGVMVKTDNTGTLYFDFSNDGTNWDSTFPVSGFKVASGVSEFHTAVKLGRYFRCRLVNDTGAQTYLRLTTYYGYNFVPSVAPLNQSSSIDSDALLVRTTIGADDARIGRLGGASGNTKWGSNSDIDAASAEVVAAFGGTYAPPSSSDTYTITYNSSTDGAGGGATGATQLAITYIDTDGNPATSVHTLGSSGSDVTSFSGFGINRVAVSATGTADHNVNDITVAQTSGNTEALVPATYGVTQQAIFHAGANHDAVAKFLLINVLKLSGGGGSPRVTVTGKVYNRAVDSNYIIFEHNIDTDVENTVEIQEPVGFLLSPTDTLWFEASTDVNNTSVSIRFSLVEYQRS